MKYDTTNWNLICNHLKKVNFKDIHLLNRAQLLNDAFNFVLSGNLSCISLLELLEYAEQETDYIPLYVLSEGIQSLDPIISGTDYYKKFQVRSVCASLILSQEWQFNFHLFAFSRNL